MTHGVIYLLGPAGYAELLCVSLFTLRKHYQGPVTVFCTDDESQSIALQMTVGAGIDVVRTERPNNKRHATYCTKPVVSLLSPYDQTVFLDCDTLVAGDFSDLFEPSLAVVQFSDWVSTGPKVSGRIRQWESLNSMAHALVWKQLHQAGYPAINTGVFGFHRSELKFIEIWRNWTLEGQHCSFTDEIAMQLLYAGRAKVFDDRFNCSPRFGKHKEDARIWHLHGRGHVRKNEGQALWWPVFREAVAARWGGLDQWAGQYDAGVKRMMGEMTQ